MIDGPVYVAGHRGLVGSAILRAMAQAGMDAPVVRTRSKLDLTDQAAVQRFFRRVRPSVVFMAAAKVGGILANNTHRWDFLFENLQIEVNMLGAALEAGVERVVFLGSSCIYPKLAPQPIREEYLLAGALEPTNEPYAIAKIAGLKLVDAANEQHGNQWVSLMPTNLYGPGDNFDLRSSHVLPAMIRKFHEAKLCADTGRPVPVALWGTGRVRREFLYVEDLAAAALHLASLEETGLFNVGYGSDLTIRELAELVADVVGYHGRIEWDQSKPDGTPAKLLDSSRIHSTGWRPTVGLRDGIRRTYDWFRQHAAGEVESVGATLGGQRGAELGRNLGPSTPDVG
jgi:GDP-L-fucose synthase